MAIHPRFETLEEARGFAVGASPVRRTRLSVHRTWVGRLYGRLAVAAARRMAPQGPPVIVLSMPRSGSSWVGETLGHARNALYLREPVTQGVLLLAHRDRPVYPVDVADPDPDLRYFSDRALAAVPGFPAGVVRYPEQWSLHVRRRSRLVVKEVNPLACRWYIERYRARIVLLVRHPASVASSYVQRGWCGHGDTLEKFGAHYAMVYSAALDALDGFDDYMVQSYEELCLAPAQMFLRLFEFAEVVWDAGITDFVEQRTTSDSDAQPFNTERDSRVMAHIWQRRLTPAQVAAV